MLRMEGAILQIETERYRLLEDDLRCPAEPTAGLDSGNLDQLRSQIAADSSTQTLGPAIYRRKQIAVAAATEGIVGGIQFDLRLPYRPVKPLPLVGEEDATGHPHHARLTASSPAHRLTDATILIGRDRHPVLTEHLIIG